MARAVISYDKDLPEIPDRAGQSHIPPTSYLRRQEGSLDKFEIVEGRRPSRLLLVNRLREAVGRWRDDGYPGASPVTQRLFNYWFDEDHEIGGRLFRYYFGQREAVETLAYLTEVAKIHDSKPLIDKFAEIHFPAGSQMLLPGAGIVHQTGIGGRRQIRRYIPEVESEAIQDLPAQGLRRYAFKMATGSGKTVVMAMIAVWSFFHKHRVPGSDLSTNFLILAPNVIVYQRLERDFGGNQVFYNLPLIPPEWRAEWTLKVILRGEATEPDPSGNLFLTNIHQIYQSRDAEWTPANAVDALLGRAPAGGLGVSAVSMLDRIKSLRDLVVMNDEAHHVHEEHLEWHKSLAAINEALPAGLSFWLDFSATPKDQNGTYFPWIVCDYPLAQAVEDRIVKAPIIVHRVKRGDPDHVTKENVAEAYAEWLLAALSRWREHFKTYEPLGPKPVLFIMAEKNAFADQIKRWLVTTSELKLKEGEVLVIHTDDEGDVKEKDLEAAREAARDIDEPTNKVKVIVSVLMLREGWDVRNVTIVLGLRPFTSTAKILPEQAVGRGLRLMEGIGPDRTQTLEVIGTEAFEEFVRQLESEGVGIKTLSTPPPPPVRIEPVLEKIAHDIAIPLSKPAYVRNYKRLSDLDPGALQAIYEEADLDEVLRIKLRMEFATVGTEIHRADISLGRLATSQEMVASITNKVSDKAKLSGVFAELFPIVRDYLTKRCFGRTVDLDTEAVRSHLASQLLQETVAKYLAREIGKLTAEMQPLQLENHWLRLSSVREFTWRRNLPLLSCSKTIFNLVATYNDFEKAFAGFLDRATDVIHFASLGTTEQESGANFRVDYIKPGGAIGFYYPDWVLVERTKPQRNWIVETKGRVWEDTAAKDAAIEHWCRQVTIMTGQPWHFVRVNQRAFERRKPATFSQCVPDTASLVV